MIIWTWSISCISCHTFVYKLTIAFHLPVLGSSVFKPNLWKRFSKEIKKNANNELKIQNNRQLKISKPLNAIKLFNNHPQSNTKLKFHDLFKLRKSISRSDLTPVGFECTVKSGQKNTFHTRIFRMGIEISKLTG